MAHKMFLAVVCAALLSVPFNASLLASGGAGKNKKTIIVHAVGVDGERVPAVGIC